MRDPILSRDERSFLEAARRAVLATITPDGRPRLVPICFAVDPARPVLYTPLDEKPKSVDDVARLARVRDILRDGRVTVLVDRWDEDWTRLAWLRCDGAAFVIEPGASLADRAGAIVALRDKYAQYGGHELEARPIIRMVIERTASWGAIGLG
jgi:PPOX class probable F420-dependent enzyme